MKPAFKYIMGIGTVGLLGLVIFFSYRFMQQNELGQINTLKSKAKNEYLSHEFVKATLTYQQLVDSLKVQEDELSINYANASFLSFYTLNKKGNGGSIGNKSDNPGDSVHQQFLDKGLSVYGGLSSSPNPRIAGIAENQLGYAGLKANDIFEGNKADSLLTESLVHFKNALMRDPENDSARYNYELVKKLVLYPETILSQTKSLVAQKKYREAANLLDGAMKRDRRLQQQKELLTRIQTIIGIDTLKTSKL
jgi:Ca-activated chloride channel homolog